MDAYGSGSNPVVVLTADLAQEVAGTGTISSDRGTVRHLRKQQALAQIKTLLKFGTL